MVLFIADRCHSLNDTSLLTPYEQYFIQTLHHEGQLVPEQDPGEKNPLLQLAINPSYIALEESGQVSSFTPST
jgi:hypothetical protein